MSQLPASEAEALVDDAPWLGYVLSKACPLPSDDKVLAAIQKELENMKTDSPAREAAITKLWNQLSPDQQAKDAVLYPWLVGNLNGIPLPDRALACHVLAANEYYVLPSTIAKDEGLVKQAELNGGDVKTLQDQLDRDRKLLSSCKDWIYGTIDQKTGTVTEHQIVLFSPGEQRFAEVTGNLNSKNIAILVPGTGTNMSNIQSYTEDAQNFVDAAGGSLAMITYMDGDEPTSIWDARKQGYQLSMAPRLGSFSQALQQEFPNARLVAVGHSYGATIVGEAERDGMKADAVVLVEPAGMGKEVYSPSDFTDPDTPTYVMTIPGDAIGLVQGLDRLRADPGLGADPMHAPGVTILSTKGMGDPGHFYEDKWHDAPLKDVGTPAWTNLLTVMTNGVPIVEPAPPLPAAYH